MTERIKMTALAAGVLGYSLLMIGIYVTGMVINSSKAVRHGR